MTLAENDVLARFAALFNGLQRAYGCYDLGTETRARDGKVEGKPRTVKEPLTDKQWRDHLEGRHGLGIVPIRDDQACVFGAIDIDEYDLDLRALNAKIQSTKLPLVLCRTKSGGAHLYLFTAEPVAAAVVRQKLVGYAKTLGYGGSEVFPKQEKLIAEDTGNWINLPYFDGKGPTQRYALDADGNALITLAEFVAYAEQHAVTEAQLVEARGAAPFSDGPPCLQALWARAVGQGTRNQVLYQTGVYLRAKHADDWEARLEQQAAAMHPPLDAREVAATIKSLGRGSGFYRCKDAPFASACDKSACRMRPYGVGGGGTPEWVAELNDKYFVTQVGGKTIVFMREYDDGLRRWRWVFQSFASFAQYFANQYVEVAGQQGVRHMPKGAEWLRHPQRRTHEGLVMAPGHGPEVNGRYNLWQGFAVNAKAGDCSLYKAHMRDVICGGNEQHFAYLWNWMANAVQNPGEPGKVAIVLHGEKGAGKGIFARTFGELFGTHFLQINSPKHLAGNFNYHLRDCVSLFADEAFFVGDKGARGKLQGLVTEPVIMIEKKGVDAEQAPNYLHIIMASDTPDIVPAGRHERRYFMVDVSDAHMQDHAYFSKLVQEIERGGREALLHELLTTDLNGWSVWAVPRTSALVEQQELSMDSLQSYFYSKLQDGFLHTADRPWTAGALRDVMYEEYVRAAHAMGDRYPRSREWMGRRMLQWGARKTRKIIELEGRSGYGWEFESLAQCRALFAKDMGWREHEWNEDVPMVRKGLRIYDDAGEPRF
jgi:hypothetical protein